MSDEPRRFDEEGHAEKWRNEVAGQMNALQDRAEFVEGDPYIQPVDVEFVAATRAIVDRVREFEEIEYEPEKRPLKVGPPRRKTRK